MSNLGLCLGVLLKTAVLSEKVLSEKLDDCLEINYQELISGFTEGDVISTCLSVLDDQQLMSSGLSHFCRYLRRERIAEFKVVKNFISEAIIHEYVIGEQEKMVDKDKNDYTPEDLSSIMNDAKARHILHSSLDSVMSNRVIGCKIAKEIWDA
ncbi:hypothetical protein AgCh_004488 [Apium graveolens]